MNIKCPKCMFAGGINETQIPEQGRNVKCPVCSNVFLVKNPLYDQQKAPANLANEPEPTEIIQPSHKRAERFTPPKEVSKENDSAYQAEFEQTTGKRFSDETSIMQDPPDSASLKETEEEEVEADGDNEKQENEKKKPAGFWIRLVAFHVDLLLVSYITFVVALLLTAVSHLLKTGNGGNSVELLSSLFFAYQEIQGSTSGIILCFLISIFYQVFFLNRKGATPGKMFLGIEVISVYGGYLSPFKSLIRYLSYFLSFLPLTLGFIWAAFNKQKMALHDFVAESRVVWIGEFSFFRLILALMLPSVPIILFLLLFSSLLLMGFSVVTQDVIGKAIERGAKAIETGVKEGVKEGYIEYKVLENPKKLIERPLEKKIDKIESQVQEGLTSEMYDDLISGLKATDEYDPYGTESSISIGPIFIQQSSFWDQPDSPHIWLKIKTRPIPNIKLKRNFVRISIDSVIGKSNENLYDYNSGFEKLTFQYLDLSPGIDENFTAIRTVYLKPGVKERDISSISGKVFLTLPLNLKVVEIPLYGSYLEKVIDIDNNHVTLKDFNENMVLLNYTGDITKLVTVYGFDKTGDRIRQRGRSKQNKEELFNLKYHFYGPVNKIHILIAQGYMEKVFPFSL